MSVLWAEWDFPSFDHTVSSVHSVPLSGLCPITGTHSSLLQTAIAFCWNREINYKVFHRHKDTSTLIPMGRGGIKATFSFQTKLFWNLQFQKLFVSMIQLPDIYMNCISNLMGCFKRGINKYHSIPLIQNVRKTMVIFSLFSTQDVI